MPQENAKPSGDTGPGATSVAVAPEQAARPDAGATDAGTASLPDTGPLLIVGIGASAGGLEAFKNFFAQMPVNSGMAFVLVQHLAPQHTSLLTELIGRGTAMPVLDAVDGEPVQADHIYVIPPDATLTIVDGALAVSKPAPPRQYRWPINTFFTSLAHDQGDCAVCIVLSGTGSDGARGLRAVKECGGLTLAQSGFDHVAMTGMPASAAATGLVDAILPVEEMPARLLAHLQHLRATDSDKGADGERQDLAAHLRTICRLLRAEVGHDFSQYKEKTLTRRIQRRMHVVQVETVPGYIDYLRGHPEEHQQLFREVLIGVTEFFRDPKAFEALQTTAIPKLLASKGADDVVRVWVSGCATGEEAYSIAIALREAMGLHDKADPKVQIFATDIDDRAVSAARAGRYKSPLVGVSEQRQERWFTRDGDDWCVAKSIREMCVFSPHSAIKDPPFSRMDLVSCRNLLIYLNSDLQERLLRTFHYALRPDGYLLLGSSEGLGRSAKLFTVINKSHRLYARRADSGVGLPALPERGKPARDTPAKRGTETRAGSGAQDWIDLGARRALEKYSPAYVVIDEQHDIVRFAGNTGRYLEPAAGAASLNLFGLLHRGLRVAARSVVKQAVDAGKPVLQSGLSVSIGDQCQRLRLIAVPLPIRDAGVPLCVLAFDEIETVPAGEADSDHSDDRGTAVVQGLEDELANARAELQAAIEQQAMTGEEMKSTNEEYQSVNEELQSSNEELETSKEEMQSINEELQTVNAEIQDKNDSLAHLNNDLQNLLDSTQIATLFLDAQLRVSNFTPAMTAVYHLRDSDRGRPITEIASRIDYPDLRHDAGQVLRTLAMVERELPASDSGLLFQLRIRPYRTVDNVIDGVVLTFVDISERQQYRIERARLAAIVDSSREMIIGHRLDGTITSWNASAHRILGHTASQAIGQSISVLAPDSTEQTRQLLEACAKHRGSTEMEMQWVRQDGSQVPVAVTCSPVLDMDGTAISGSLIARDNSERQRIDAELKASQRHLEQLIEQTTVGIAEIDATGRFLKVNPAYCTIVERSAETLAGMRKQDITHPDDVPGYMGQLHTLMAGGPAFQMEKRYLRPDGSEVWVDNSVSLLTDPGGRPDRVLAILQDISERHRAAEYQQLLLGELNHRVKNTLASVQAIAQQTAAHSTDLDQFRATFLSRLHALSNTHNLLAVDAWSGAGLREIVLSELAPYQHDNESRVQLSGAALKLNPKAALALSMTLHELATNAAKYGALSVPDGRVAVQWETRVSEQVPWLHLLWTESGGPPVTPPTRRGFGSRLISEGLGYELQGTAALQFDPAGVTCRIELPMAEIESPL
ncbi:chemotaxis protein CheB [Lysobacter sp. A421]